MIRIWIKPRGGFGESKLHKEIENVEWSYEVVPHMADIDHKRYSVKVTDEKNEWVFDDYCDEYCPCCDSEVVIPSFGRSFCPNCGEPILPCSMCHNGTNYIVECENCPYHWDFDKER